MEAKLLFLHTLSPLHTGTGQGVGVIDLPIAREKATNIPYIPGSSLKGVLRDACREDEEIKKQVFGTEVNSDEMYAGAVNFTDLRLILLPVRSLKGVFAWVTSPFLLRRLVRDGEAAMDNSLPKMIPIPQSDERCLVTTQHECTRQTKEVREVILEDLVLQADNSKEVDAWAVWFAEAIFPQDAAWQEIMRKRLCVITDDIMSFLMETGTEVNARIALERDTKTTKDGALWYEESLPAETVLSGLVIGTTIKESKANPKIVFNTVKNCTATPLQVGGSATVGRGICQLNMVPANSEG
ncbi:MAG: type III-B CRISPR module RAMP protein Cmr4 [Pelolinea sp.]|jgi:CRISPR-associated protein Cmr4|nr:type III-B CRISPR module RAMP protein Cmr4 [Pelolinea sp.]